MAQNTLSKHIEEMLKKKIVASGRDVRNAEDILENLDALATEKISFGDEKTMWLDLTTKKMVAKMLDPNCRVEVPANEIIRYKDTLAVTAYFYWSDSDTFAGRGFARRSLESLISCQADAKRIEIEFEALVMGAAITRAYTDAGIGIEFYADGFDELFAQVEENDAEALLERKHEAVSNEIPVVPSIAEKKAKKTTKKVTEESEVKATAEEKAEDITLPFVNTSFSDTPSKTTSELPTDISLDEAKLVVNDVGQFAGQPLGMIYSSRPLSLIWILNNSSGEVKDAARIIIDSDANLKSRI